MSPKIYKPVYLEEPVAEKLSGAHLIKAGRRKLDGVKGRYPISKFLDELLDKANLNGGNNANGSMHSGGGSK